MAEKKNIAFHNSVKYFFNYRISLIVGKNVTTEKQFQKLVEIEKILRTGKFENELAETKPEKISELINFHLRYYTREQRGNIIEFVNELKQVSRTNLDKYQRDKFISVIAELEKNEAPAVKTKRTTQITSYKSEKYSLSKLFNAVKGKLIDKDTPKEDFNNVFSSKPVSEINSVKWHDSNASELLYFILQLMEKEFIAKEKRVNYNRLKGCFVKNDGKPFTENFKELKQSLDISFSTEKSISIDKILTKLTT